MTSTRSERAAAALRRVLDVAARVMRSVRVLAIVAAGSGATAWIAWLIDSPPAEADEWIPRFVVLAVALAPPAILFLFLAGLRELLELPDRARALPADVRARAAELRPAILFAALLAVRRRSSRSRLLRSRCCCSC